MAKPAAHRWEFKARFRRHAFGWRSQPAIARIRQAVAEIKKVARQQPALAADGAVTLLERLSPALEQVDSSSGAIGTAVNHAIADLVPIIAGAPADATTRQAWLERLFEAHERDQIPYIERLADLAATTPDQEGKWFAAAKDAGLFDEALALASRSPCDPQTLTRAARDQAEERPAFATAAGLLALDWLAQGAGYEIDSADVWAAYRATLAAAERQSQAAKVKDDIRALVASDSCDRFVKDVLGGELGLTYRHFLPRAARQGVLFLS
jgi:hypothetical protein